MSVTPDRRNPPAVQPDSFLVILWNEKRASDAWEAYRAIALAQAYQPSLGDNPAWTILRDEAFENFSLAFEVLQ